MIRICFFVGSLFFISQLRAAAEEDTTSYLSAKDTIFIEVSEFQEKTFQYEAKEKQTLYSIAKFYGLPLETLYFYNPQYRQKQLSIYDKITIPLPNRAILRYEPQNFDPELYIPVCYIVKRGDNLYRIAKVHFKMPVDSVMQRNQLSSHSLFIGQVLQLGWASIYGIPAEFQQTRAHLEFVRNEKTRQKFEVLREKSGKRSYSEQGLATWQKNALGQTQLFALHRQAAINSWIAVENPMQRKIVLVKVIGRIPERAYANQVMIVLSREAALQLGAKDQGFFVRINYLR